MKTILSAIFLVSSLAISSMAVELGKPAPDFTLTSVEGKQVNLSDYKGKVVVLEWYNPGCPFVQKHYKNGDMQALQGKYTGQGVVWLNINSTNPAHQDYMLQEKAAAQAKEAGIKSTAVLQDADGKVGHLYEAKTTPHMFIIDANGNLIYQGAIDDAPAAKADPKNAKNYVQAALDEVLSGKLVGNSSTKQYGCSIKYAK